MKLAVLPALIFFCCNHAHAAVVVSPYTQNFDGYAVDGATDFQESLTSAFVIVTQSGADKAYRARLTSTSSATAAVEVIGSGAGNFSVSTAMKLTELTTAVDATSMSLALAAAANTATFGTTAYRAVMDFKTGGFLLLKNGSSMAFTDSSGTVPAVTVGSNYTMSLSAVYSNPTTAVLSLSVTDGTNTFSATYNDNAALSGTYFGYRIARNGTSTVLGVELDDFSLTAVPESSSVMMLTGGLAGLLLRRGRNRR